MSEQAFTEGLCRFSRHSHALIYLYPTSSIKVLGVNRFFFLFFRLVENNTNHI